MQFIAIKTGSFLPLNATSLEHLSETLEKEREKGKTVSWTKNVDRNRDNDILVYLEKYSSFIGCTVLAVSYIRIGCIQSFNSTTIRCKEL